jgi:hypothetical protein
MIFRGFRMSAIVTQIVTLIASPATSLKDAIAEYQKRKEEKERLKTQLGDSLQAEVKEYESLNEEMTGFGQTLLGIVHSIGERPTSDQLIRFLNCVSKTPRILTRQIILFIHIARACRDISRYEGFMDSLKTNNRFMFDFIHEMGRIYFEKNSIHGVVMDTGYFHFVLMNKKEILKGVDISKTGKEEIKLLLEKMDLILEGLKARYMRRYIKKMTVKKWNISYNELAKVITEDVKIETGGMDLSGLNDFMPSGLRELQDFLSKPPPL